ncbi:hypothetical protein LOTGIDRAFT_157511 [Lottia gigantea]|uniref:Uncharacterized protein n=1 Tax=Lottia gigantea TaxID=225164 RepID=V4AVI5_LOTGI|nr:hypothetical protein LOTGIDRAFT_157511 [Lottia gigantea]ESP01333.1 hypothetical protein LOTGIDRAFT_157511 [Lottia gigantea]
MASKIGLTKYNLKNIKDNFAEDSVKLKCVRDKIYELELIKTKRKLFGKEVRKAKRQHWYREQNNLQELTSKNRPDLWEEFGKIGIGAKRTSIPMEIINENGDISDNVDQI